MRKFLRPHNGRPARHASKGSRAEAQQGSARRAATLLTAAVFAFTIATSAQTKITPPKNGYSPAQDVELGQQASAEVKKEMPLLNDDSVDDYVESVGQRLVSAIPPQFQHGEFRYSFDVVNMKEINAFALPGGPMYLNRGMIEASENEAEMAGVMAHEISHVALRHGTAQATKAQKFQIGAVAGQILGAIVGGTAGSVIAQGSQFGLGAYFLKYSREYESQADLLGAQILARAGYNPREMADMFKTIESQSRGSGGPEWLSSHPNPGNRYDAINREAATLQVQGSAPSDGRFASVKSELSGKPPALTAEQVAKGQTGGNQPVGTSGRSVRVEPPSGQYKTYQPGKFMRVSVPANWQQLGSGGQTVTYAPEGAVFQGEGGGSAFTHGIEIGVAPNGTGNLQRDTEALIQSFAQTNPRLQRAGGYSGVNIGGRRGLATTLSNVSEVTGAPELVSVSTTQLSDGSVLFLIGVAPKQEAQAYGQAFSRVRSSIQIADQR